MPGTEHLAGETVDGKTIIGDLSGHLVNGWVVGIGPYGVSVALFPSDITTVTGVVLDDPDAVVADVSADLAGIGLRELATIAGSVEEAALFNQVIVEVGIQEILGDHLVSPRQRSAKPRMRLR